MTKQLRLQLSEISIGAYNNFFTYELMTNQMDYLIILLSLLEKYIRKK